MYTHGGAPAPAHAPAHAIKTALVAPYDADGKFVVRTHTTAGQYVLCVVYKGKPTHHLINPSDDGNL